MATILIVEDEDFIRQIAGWTIDDMGHRTLLAGNVSDALSILSTPQSIHALFVDIRLHALIFGGYDVADQAIKLLPELRVLYTSGSPLTAEMRSRFVDGGRFLQKPYSPEALEVSVSALLH